LLLLAASSAVSAQPAAPAQPATASLSVSPDKVEVDLFDRNIDLPFTISASQTQPVTVVLSISDLSHDLDGTPQFPDEPAPVLTVEPSRVTLAPGTSVNVRVTGSIPATATALYAGLVAAIDKPPSTGVDVVTRIGVPLLLRGPQPWHPAAVIEDVALPSVAEGQPPRVEAVIRNTGDVHIRPSGTFTILKDGNVVGTAALHGDAVLPSLARRLGVSWSPPDGLRGPLTARLDLDEPASTGERDGLGYPPPVAVPGAGAANGQAQPAGDARSRPGTTSNGGGRILAALIALLLIVAVAVAGLLQRRRSRTLAESGR
jgi:P pilus assembly chaperone PapD